jgi:hypothetical protein
MFVLVIGCGIDAPVSGLKRTFYGSFDLLACFCTVNAQPKPGHFNAV